MPPPFTTLKSPLSPPPSPTGSSPRRPTTAATAAPAPAAGSSLNLHLPRLTVTCHAPCQVLPFADLGLRSPPPSLYDVLRVKRGATMTEIKSAYRTLAKMYHPDALGQGEGESAPDGRYFIELRDAYVTLSDPTARALYDISLGGGRARRGGAIVVGLDGPGFGPTRRWETDQCW